VLEIPVQQHPVGEWRQRGVEYQAGEDGTYETQVARAKEYFDQDPAHLAEGECSSSKKSKRCVEAFFWSVMVHENL